MNLARPSDLTVIDAIEGSDGKGNYVRMDMLMVGKNAVATDAVALAVAGFVPQEQEQIRLCSQLGLGPGRLDQIDVVGASIEDVQFTLGHLNEGVLELPMPYCLDRLSLGELQIIGKGLKLHGFLPADAELPASRADLTATLLSVLTEDGYIQRALACLPETGLEVLSLVKEHGGTSGNYYDILNRYTAIHHESNSFWAGLRSMMRLGLAFIFQGQHKFTVMLAEGVTKGG